MPRRPVNGGLRPRKATDISGSARSELRMIAVIAVICVIGVIGVIGMGPSMR